MQELHSTEIQTHVGSLLKLKLIPTLFNTVAQTITLSAIRSA